MDEENIYKDWYKNDNDKDLQEQIDELKEQLDIDRERSNRNSVKNTFSIKDIKSVLNRLIKAFKDHGTSTEVYGELLKELSGEKQVSTTQKEKETKGMDSESVHPSPDSKPEDYENPVVVEREDLEFIWKGSNPPPNRACHDDFFKRRRKIKEKYVIKE